MAQTNQLVLSGLVVCVYAYAWEKRGREGGRRGEGGWGEKRERGGGGDEEGKEGRETARSGGAREEKEGHRRSIT